MAHSARAGGGRSPRGGDGAGDGAGVFRKALAVAAHPAVDLPGRELDRAMSLEELDAACLWPWLRELGKLLTLKDGQGIFALALFFLPPGCRRNTFRQ